jgi:hypothetical protein
MPGFDQLQPTASDQVLQRADAQAALLTELGAEQFPSVGGSSVYSRIIGADLKMLFK